MQFHLDGFRAGDPTIEPVNTQSNALQGDALPKEVDVLIVGNGPAGLTLAAQLAAFPNITTRIVDQKDGPMELGQADGIACRTIEMFNAFGFAERVLKEAYWVNEVSFWKPDPADRSKITRTDTIQDTEDGLSEFPHLILNQARVHDFYLDVMRNAPNRLEPDYSRQVIDVAIDPKAGTKSSPSHPVTVTLERTDPDHAGQRETVKARYVVGCDGARSAVRKSLGRELRGDSAHQAWGVMDVLCVTDFPDIRKKATIHSANEGNVLIIPREGGYLVRLYVELDKLTEGERVASRNITSDHLIAAAQRILHPYTLDVKEIAWWSVYEIGQRLCDKFDNLNGEASATRIPNVFIAGDACHTHSPKAGQGMNVSMQDTFNLGWKLAGVLEGRIKPEILHSYSEERQTIAKELIDFDGKFAKMFSARPNEDGKADSNGVDPKEFQKYFVQQGRFTAGTATRYTPSVLTGPDTHQELAKGLVIGMRFHSAPVVRLSDAKPVHLGHCAKADGRWRLYAFASKDDRGQPGSDIHALCDFLQTAPISPMVKFNRKGDDQDGVLDVRAIFQQPHRSLAIEAMPKLLLPRKGKYGLVDYEKIYCPDLKSGDDIFDMRGIDHDHGCMVLVRPDQYISHVLPLDAYGALSAFLNNILIARNGA
ncbi:phenol 2-monooxygenase [Thalassospira sp. HJ]|uniref:FAD-binding monooxygenase n=1 Tax=Thalassospira sp. HJ TaxID=1616823 RepID=UPI0005CDF0E8|nr:FAD-binding monooxygenase [Thalassospira sp. HJ]KJE36627.1 phenol 2-monooxygenase [Thalassospira sp. HJ]